MIGKTLRRFIGTIVLGLAGVLWMAGAMLAAENLASIDGVMQALYESLTFAEGKAPDLERLRSLYAPGARFTRINRDNTVDLMDRETFIQSFEQRIRTGQLKSFHESEIRRHTQVFGRMAQVLSVYKKGLNTTDPAKMVRGINGLQLFLEDGNWKVISILWTDERPDQPIPDEFLK